MTLDRRTTPANSRVAASSLKGKVEAERFVEGDLMQCVAAAAGILDAPGGSRTSQLLYGATFLGLEVHDGHVFGQCTRDGYCGYVLADLLAPAEEVTHWVAAPQTHSYPGPDMKLAATGPLYFGSEVYVVSEAGDWSQLSSGDYVPAGHILPLGQRLSDPVDVADLFLGSPYLWGGGTRYGVDCSGLVQAAWHGCGMDCPRDSDMQEADLGRTLTPDEVPERGDLVFWKGHVGIVTAPNRLLHANAHHMSVVYEPLDEARARIATSGGGEVTRIARP